MLKRTMGEINCDYCNIEFSKPLTELKRNDKLNRKNYCSRHCLGKANTKNIPNNKGRKGHSKGGIHDEFTPFRMHLRKARKRYPETNLTLLYLKKIWDNQNGICIYSKVILLVPQYKNKNNSIYTASLDRIDSTIGYVKGNVQFISIAMNYMKGNLTHNDTIKLINIIKSN